MDLRSNKLSLQIKSSKKPNSPNKKKRKKKSSHLGTTIDVTITQIVHVHTSIICIKYTLTIYKKCAIKIWNQYMTCTLILLSSLLFVSLLQMQVVLVLWNFQNRFFGALSFSKFKLTQIILFDQILYYLAISKIQWFLEILLVQVDIVKVIFSIITNNKKIKRKNWKMDDTALTFYLRGIQKLDVLTNSCHHIDIIYLTI